MRMVNPKTGALVTSIAISNGGMKDAGRRGGADIGAVLYLTNCIADGEAIYRLLQNAHNHMLGERESENSLGHPLDVQVAHFDIAARADLIAVLDASVKPLIPGKGMPVFETNHHTAYTDALVDGQNMLDNPAAVGRFLNAAQTGTFGVDRFVISDGAAIRGQMNQPDKTNIIRYNWKPLPPVAEAGTPTPTRPGTATTTDNLSEADTRLVDQVARVAGMNPALRRALLNRLTL